MQDEKLKITLYGEYLENCNTNISQDQKDEKQKIRLKTIFALQIASTHNHTNYEILVAYSLQ